MPAILALPILARSLFDHQPSQNQTEKKKNSQKRQKIQERDKRQEMPIHRTKDGLLLLFRIYYLLMLLGCKRSAVG